ncbi:hypothetical protein Tco_1318002 [Tanacetum coccineum]
MDVNTSVKVNSSVVMNDSVNYVEMCNKCLELKAEPIKQHNMNNTSVNQTEPSFNQLFELNNLKAELQAKDTTIEKLKANIKRKSFCHNNIKNDLRKFKGKDIVDNAAHVSNATTIAPGMYKLDPVILAPKAFEQEKSQNPLDSASYSACMYVKLIQELLGYVRDTCPDIHKPSKKLVAITPINKKKIVRFADTPLGNTKNDRIQQTPSSNEKNKVEVQSRKVKSSLNKRNSESKNVCNEHVKHLVKGAKALCSVCNECLFDANLAMCLIDHMNSMNVRVKSVSKKNKKRKEWKPTGKVFNSIGYKWKPTGRIAPKHVVTRVYTSRPKVPKSVQNSKPKVAKSMTSNKIEPGTSRGSDTSVAPSSSSLIDCKLSKLFCGIWTPDAPST